MALARSGVSYSIYVEKNPNNYTMMFIPPVGEDVAHEHVHPDPAVVYRAAVGGEIHRGIAGVPVHPHHDRAATPTRPYTNLPREGASSCESSSLSLITEL